MCGLFDRRYRLLKMALAGWSLILVARSYGTPVAANLLNWIPGLSHVVTFRYMDPGVELAAAVLASFGVADVLEHRTPRGRLLLAAGGVAAVALLSAENSRHYVQSILGDAAWEKASLLWGLGTATLIIALIASHRSGRLGALVLVSILPLEAIAMLVPPEFAAPRSGGIDMALVTYLQRHIGDDRVFSLDQMFRPNYGSYFGIRQLDVNDLPVPKDFENMVQTDLDPNVYPAVFDGTAALDPSGMPAVQAFSLYIKNYEKLGVKYVILAVSFPPPAIPDVRLTRVYQDALAAVYQLPNVSPFFQDSVPECIVRMLGYQEARVDCPEPSTLLRNEIALPGWSIRIDNHDSSMGTSPLAQETVRVPAGDHVVTYSFEPAHLSLAWMAALAGLVSCLGSVGTGIAGWVGRRRRDARQLHHGRHRVR